MAELKKRLLITFMLIMFVVIFPDFAAAASSTQLMTKPEGHVAADGSIVAWSACVSGDWDIYCLNRSSGEQRQLTGDPATQSNPSVWHNYIVYQDNRNHPDTGYFDIYLHNLDTGTATLLSHNEGDHQDPVIANNKVAWVDRKAGNNDVMLYDMATGNATRISSADAQAFGLVFDGETAAWADFRNGNLDIYCYVVSSGQEQRITWALEEETAPLVYGGKIVWAVEYNSFRQVYIYDLNTKLKTRLTVGQENHFPLAFNGSQVLIRENGQLALNSVDVITEQPVKAAAAITKQAFLIGDEVVWFDGASISSEPLQTALDRGQQVKPASSHSDDEALITPPAPEKVTPKKEDKNVKATQDTILVSPDQRMSLKIFKGSFDQDINITLQQYDPVKRESFISLSPVYEWRVDGGQAAKIPMELTLNYKDLVAEDQEEKVCGFTFDQGNKFSALLSQRNKNAKLLTTKVTGSGKSALLIYDRKFLDTDEHWANHVISVIAAHQIIDGYEDGSFKPDRPMTRAELVRVLVSAWGGPDEKSNPQVFADVSSNFWAAPYISTAYRKGWIAGYGNNFKPNEPITREQMISIFMRVYKGQAPDDFKAVSPRELASFADNGQVSEWAAESMKTAVGCGMVQGFNNQLAPKKQASRAEAATILYKFLDRLGVL